MHILAHKNDGKGLIKDPVILISESSITSIEEIYESIPPELEPIILEESLIPDKKYIKCWILENSRLSVNMEKAREIFKDKLRKARFKPLQELDILYQRATETNSDTSEIISQKQCLRDLPENPEIDKCKSTAELDALFVSLGFEP